MMKKSEKKKILLCIIAIALIAASFFAGSALKTRKDRLERKLRCEDLISLAMQKVDEVADPDVREAMISNVYAAYVLCDDPYSAARMHEIWNTLIFYEDSYIGNEDELFNQLLTVFPPEKD